MSNEQKQINTIKNKKKSKFKKLVSDKNKKKSWFQIQKNKTFRKINSFDRFNLMIPKMI